MYLFVCGIIFQVNYKNVSRSITQDILHKNSKNKNNNKTSYTYFKMHECIKNITENFHVIQGKRVTLSFTKLQLRFPSIMSFVHSLYGCSVITQTPTSMTSCCAIFLFRLIFFHCSK